MKKKTAKLREELRFDRFEVESSPFHDLMPMCLGKGIIHNPNIIRIDDPITGDIVFYEKEKETISFSKKKNLKLTPVKYLWEKDIKIKEK